MYKRFVFPLISVISVVLILSSVSCNQKADKTVKADSLVADTLDVRLIKLNEAVSKYPAQVKPWLDRAVYFIGMGLYNEALRDVNQALTLDEKDPEVYVVLSDVYLFTGKTQRSLEALKKAKQLSPADAAIDVKTARLFLTMSDYKQTFNYLRSALKIDPENAEAFFISGLANEEMGDTAKAIDSYQMAVARDQKHFDALKQLGILFSIRHDKLAIDYLRNASQIRPDSPEPLYILGMFYQDNGEPDRALGIYREIIQIDTAYKLAHYNTGYIYLVYKQEYQKALEAFTTALDLDPDYTDALYNRGYTYELMGDIVNARKDYENVLRMHVNDDKAVTGLNRLDALQ